MTFRAAVLTVSDRASRGQMTDTSGPMAAEMLAAAGFAVSPLETLPDERGAVAAWLRSRCEGHDLLVTTGGTGLGRRDVTPEATLDVVEREVPGLAELMRLEGLKSTPLAALSRARVGVRQATLIVNLPGSERGARESLAAIVPALGHALQLLTRESSGPRRVNLNSDLGEGAPAEAAILALIDSANVCCGAHAGSVTETLDTVRRCAALGVEVGAHPGYDDRETFGRAPVLMTPDNLERLVRYQVAAIAAVAPLGYIKAHGALYHHCQADAEAAAALARVAADFGVGLMGQPGYAILEACRAAGVPALREGFADRAYLPSGLLAPRSEPGAVLEPEAAAEQALRLARSGEYDTICLHGDSPGAAETARRVREALTAAGIATGPLGRGG